MPYRATKQRTSAVLPIVRDGLQCEYRFDERSGMYLRDYSGHEYHAKLGASPAAPLWTSAGLSFDGVNDYADTNLTSMGATSLFATAGQSFTIMLVASVISGPTSTLIGKASATGGNMTFRIFMSSGTNLTSTIRGTSGGATTIAASFDSNWHCHTVRWNGTAAIHRLDNGSNLSLNVGTAVEETTQRIMIGARTNTAANFLSGSEAYLAIYDTALSDAQISSNYTVLKAHLAQRGIPLP